jgi:hypothetical protein
MHQIVEIDYHARQLLVFGKIRMTYVEAKQLARELNIKCETLANTLPTEDQYKINYGE